MKKIILGFTLALAFVACMGATKINIGGGTGVSGLVDEFMLRFTNIETANRSAAKHGLAQKLSGHSWQVETGANVWGDLDDLLDWGSGPFAPHVAGEIPIRSGTNWTVVAPTTAGFLQWGDGPSLGSGNEWFIDAVPSATTGHAGLLTTLSGSATDVLLGTGVFGPVPGLSGGVTSTATDSTNANRLVKFSNAGGTEVASSTMISESGSTVTIDGNLSVIGTLGSGATDLTVDTITVGGGTTPLAGILTGVANICPQSFGTLDVGGAPNCTGTNPKIMVLTVTGARVGVPGSRLSDVVIVSYEPFNLATDARFVFFQGWVSADDEVTVAMHLLPTGAGSYDPPCFDLTVTVFHYPDAP
jgi:hypothetical protein